MHIPSHLLLVNQTKQHFLHPRPLCSTAYLKCYIVFSTFKSPQIISSDCLDIHTFKMRYEDK